MSDQPGSGSGESSENPPPDSTPAAPPPSYDAPPPAPSYGTPPEQPSYGTPPPAPTYGTPPPAPTYGTPPPQPTYGTPPPAPTYGGPPPAGGYAPAPSAGYGAAPTPNLPFANWGQRVVSALIDYVIGGVIAELFVVINHPLGYLVELLALAWTVYNKIIEGQTGQSYGKKVAGTKLISASTGQPIGAGMAVVRWIAHIIDGIPCLIGYLWPLWDKQRQTFADKIVGTYVVKL